ncbi:serine hydrolase domain-containing protein [Actinocorallia libanotica]
MTNLTTPEVTRALEESLARGEIGLQVAAYLDGELIVDTAAGLDGPSGGPVTTATLFNPFSVTKAVTATALHVQAARGLIDYAAPVTAYWPEFGANGKEATTVRDVLSHRAGIPWMPEGITPQLQADWDWMIRRIEEMEPEFAPGTTNSYHALVWGWIAGELVRRTDVKGRGVAAFVREEVLEPLAIHDLYFGLPESEFARVATLVGGDAPAEAPELLLKGMPRAVYPSARVYNEPLARTTVNPGAGSIGTARSYARLFAMLACHGELDGVRLLPAELVRSFTTPRDGDDETDRYLGKVNHVSAYGYWLAGTGPTAYPLLGEGAQTLHHPGAGGSIGWAELDTGLAVAICHNRMHSGPPPAPADDPFAPIVTAVRRLAAERKGASS